MFLSRRWSRQPAGPVELDRAHWAGQHCLFAHLGRDPVDAAGRIVSRGASTPSVFQGLRSIFSDFFVSDSAMSVPYGAWMDEASQQGTAVAMFANTAGDFMLGAVARDLGNSNIPFWLGTRQMRAYNFADFLTAHASAPINGVLYHIAGTWNHSAGGTISFHRDGVELDRVAGAGATITGNTTRMVLAARRYNTTNGCSAHFPHSALFRKQFNALEVAELRRNPWQIFRPRTLRIYSLGGAGIPVLSLPGVQDITTTSARPRVTITY